MTLQQSHTLCITECVQADELRVLGSSSAAFSNAGAGAAQHGNQMHASCWPHENVWAWLHISDCALQEGFGAVLGEARTQLALSLSALLPWLCLHFRHSRHAPLAAVCTAVRALLGCVRQFS